MIEIPRRCLTELYFLYKDYQWTIRLVRLKYSISSEGIIKSECHVLHTRTELVNWYVCCITILMVGVLLLHRLASKWNIEKAKLIVCSEIKLKYSAPVTYKNINTV